MSQVRFVHAADLHLDSPFKGLRGEAPPEVAEVLYSATFKAYENIVDLCIKEQVDALLVAGDIFDGADRSLRGQVKFVDGLNKLDRAGIRSFICHGNHDPLDGWEARIPMPPGCHRFGAEVGAAAVFPEEPERTVVQGISYPVRDVTDNLVPRFAAAKPGEFTIGLLHANVDSNRSHGMYAPCSRQDLEQSDVDYWALGHIHKREVLREAGPTIVYPGNPQGRDPSEGGARGIYLVNVNDARRVHPEFRPVDVARWERARLDVGAIETEHELLEAVERRLSDLQSDADLRHLVVRLELTGSGPMHQTISRPGFVTDLRDSINETWTSQTPFVWCERIAASTAPPFDRAERLRGTDFVGELLSLRDEVEDDETAVGEMRELLEELYVNSSARRYLHDTVPSEKEVLELADAAEQVALTELLGNEE